MAWIAVDAGTSVLKGVLFSTDGQEKAIARRKVNVLREQPGWSEQNMDELWSAVVSVIREAGAGNREPLHGIALTAQGDGCWLVDAAGRPCGNAILWNDGRAASVVDHWHSSGVMQAAFRRSGSAVSAGLLGAILAWLAHHQSARLANARYALSCGSWLFRQLTGHIAAELSDASNPFCDIRSRRYSPELLELFGAQSFAALFPPIAPSGTPHAPLSPEAAAQLGLPSGVPVLMAPYDIACTAYGSGAVADGDACIILGTTVCAEVITTALDLSGPPIGTTLALPDGSFLRAMPTLSGCEALEWAAATLGLANVAELDALASADPKLTETDQHAAIGRPFFLPYLSPAGERAPFFAAASRGSFHGLSLATTRSAIAFSVYEGLTFALRECLQAATQRPLQQIRVCGGGAGSDLWCGLIANVLGLDVLRSTERENGARGAHLFALAATGELPGIPAGIEAMMPTPTLFRHDPQAHAAAQGRFFLFQQLRDAARPGWRSLAEPLAPKGTQA